MECFRGRRSAGNLFSKALPCVPVVTFCLLLMATTVSAPSVSAVVQQRLSAEEVTALKNIQRLLAEEVTALRNMQRLLAEEVTASKDTAEAAQRSVKLFTNNWSWIKVSSFGIAGLLIAGYFADLGRDKWKHWKALRPKSLEVVFEPFGDKLAAALDQTAKTSEFYVHQVAGLRADMVGLREKQARIDLEMPPNLKEELKPFLQHMVAFEKKVAEVWDRMVTPTLYAERQLVKEVEDLRSDVATLQAQMAAATAADAERKEKKKKKNVEELLALEMRDIKRRMKDVFPIIEGEFWTADEASRWAADSETDS